MILSYYIHNLSPFIIRFGENAGLRWYGLAYVGAFVMAYFLLRFFIRRGNWDFAEAKLGDFMTLLAIFGVMVGGRLGYMFFYQWREFVANPLLVFKVWEGGMSSHGGVLGVFFFTAYYAWRHKCSWLEMGDHLVCVAPVGLFLGRCANFINGELYGRITQVRWAVIFPDAVYDLPFRKQQEILLLLREKFVGLGETLPEFFRIARDNAPVREFLASFLEPRHPSQLYEAFLEGAVLFVILFSLRVFCKRLPRGFLTGMFFTLYAVFRIGVEAFRQPDASLILGLTRGQFYSFFMLAMGVVFLLISCLKWKEKNRG